MKISIVHTKYHFLLVVANTRCDEQVALLYKKNKLREDHYQRLIVMTMTWNLLVERCSSSFGHRQRMML